jgi:purine catabolism regulator
VELLQKQYGITVKEALSLSVVNRLKVVGGREGLGRVIKLVNVIEVPDIVDWMMEGELLLTTGYSFREYPDLMENLVPRMEEKGVAGLAIKPKRFIREIPEELIRRADKHNIPLLEVPFDLSFSEIIAPILGVIFNKQNKILQKLDHAHRKLMDIVLHGSSLKGLCRETAKLIGNLVAIVDGDGNVVLSDEGADPKKMELFFSDSVNVRDEKLRFGNIREVRYSLEHTTGREKPLTVQAIKIPIVTDIYQYGHIYAIYDNPVSETDVLILERAATIAALEFTKRKAIFEIEKGYYNEFLEILLSCEFENEEDIIKRGRIFDINLQNPTAVAIVNGNSFNEMEEMRLPMKGINRQSAKEELLKAINSYRRSNKNLIVGIKGTNIVVVAELNRENSAEDLKKIVKELSRHLIDSTGSKDLKIGVGRPYQNISKISQSFQEAREALKICQLSKAASVLHFEELGFYKILSEKNKKDLYKFVEDLLAPVFAYDKNKNGELIKTLETYYEVNRNLRITSEKMFTHYNTILYRIKKIEELTGANLDNPEDSLNLEIAVNILKLLGSDQE